MLMNGWYQSGNGVVSPSQVPWSMYDIVYNFAAAPNSDGTINLLWLTQLEISQIVGVGHAAGKKVLVVVKDNDNDPSAFQKATAPGIISTFVGNLTKFVNSNGFDGTSIDWEANIVGSQYEDLLTRLRGNMGSKLIYCDMGDWGGMPTVAKDKQGIVDGFNIMCYAMSNGSPNQTIFDAMTFQAAQTNLRAMDSRMRAFSSVSPAKLLVGIPYFCVRWNGAFQPFVFGSFAAPVSQNYQDLVKDPAWVNGTQSYDTPNAASYISAPGSNQFIPYVSARQIGDIVAWAKSAGFAGISPFCLNFDDAPAWTLSSSLRAAISGSNPTPPPSTYAAPTTDSSGNITFKKLT